MGDQLMPEVQVQNDEAEAHEQLDYAVKEHPGTRVLGPGHNKTRSSPGGRSLVKSAPWFRGVFDGFVMFMCI